VLPSPRIRQRDHLVLVKQPAPKAREHLHPQAERSHVRLQLRIPMRSLTSTPLAAAARKNK
jgi:hypothetical protein